MEINTLPKNQWVKEEIKGEIKYFETKENGNTAYHNLWKVEKSSYKREVQGHLGGTVS